MEISTAKDKKPIPTIVVSRPGILQKALRAILVNIQEIDVVAYAGDALSALLLVRKHHPVLLVIDHNLLEEEVHALLLTVKREYSATQCLVIVSSKRREAFLIASGADAVVLSNTRSQEMRAALLMLAHEVSLLSE